MHSARGRRFLAGELFSRVEDKSHPQVKPQRGRGLAAMPSSVEEVDRYDPGLDQEHRRCDLCSYTMEAEVLHAETKDRPVKQLIYIDPDDGGQWRLDDQSPDDGKSKYVALTDIPGTHMRSVKRDDLQGWESREVDPLEPDQIRVAVILPRELRRNWGSETFAVPLGGGEVSASVPLPDGREGKLTIEVYPESQIENYGGRLRSYDQLQKLRDDVIKLGGYMVVGDQMQVGDEIIGGRDQIELLRMLAQHWGDQAGDQSVAFKQGWDAGRRATAETVKQAIDNAEKKYA